MFELIMSIFITSMPLVATCLALYYIAKKANEFKNKKNKVWEEFDNFRK